MRLESGFKPEAEEYRSSLGCFSGPLCVPSEGEIEAQYTDLQLVLTSPGMKGLPPPQQLCQFK